MVRIDMSKMEWHNGIKSDWGKYFRWTWVCSHSLRLDILKIL